MTAAKGLTDVLRGLAGVLRRMQVVALGLGAFLLAGCYRYIPVETPAPGTVARVRVPVQSAVADPNAPPETVSVEGAVLASGDTLVLAARLTREISPFQQYVRFDTFRVASAELASVERKEFSMGRSVGLGVAVAGGAALMAVAALGIQGGDDGQGQGDGDGTSGFTVPLSAAAKFVLRWMGMGR